MSVSPIFAIGGRAPSSDAVCMVSDSVVAMVCGRQVVLHDLESRCSAFVCASRASYVPYRIVVSPTLTHIAVVERREDLERPSVAVASHLPRTTVSVYPLSKSLHQLRDLVHTDMDDARVCQVPHVRAAGPASVRHLVLPSAAESTAVGIATASAFRGEFQLLDFSSDGSFLVLYGEDPEVREEEGKSGAGGGNPARLLMIWRWVTSTIVAAACPKEQLTRVRLRPFPFSVPPFGGAVDSSSDGKRTPSTKRGSVNLTVLGSALVITGSGPGVARQWRPTADQGLRVTSLLPSRRGLDSVIDHVWIKSASTASLMGSSSPMGATPHSVASSASSGSSGGGGEGGGGGPPTGAVALQQAATEMGQMLLLVTSSGFCLLLRPKDEVKETDRVSARAQAAAAASASFVPFEVADTITIGAPEVDDGDGLKGSARGEDLSLHRAVSTSSMEDVDEARPLTTLAARRVQLTSVSAGIGCFVVGGSHGFVAAYGADLEGDEDATSDDEDEEGEGAVSKQRESRGGTSGGLEDDGATHPIGSGGSLFRRLFTSLPREAATGPSSDGTRNEEDEEEPRQLPGVVSISISPTAAMLVAAGKRKLWSMPVLGPDVATTGAVSADGASLGVDGVSGGGAGQALGDTLVPGWGEGLATTEDHGLPFGDRGTAQGAIVCVDAAVVSPMVITASADGYIRLCNAATGRVDLSKDIASGDAAEAPTAVAIHPSGLVCAVANAHSVILFLLCAGSRRLKRWRELSTSRGSIRAVRAMRFSPDGGRLAIASGPLVFIADVWTTAEVMELNAHVASVSCIAWGETGSTIASGGEDGALYLWDPFTGKRIDRGCAVIKGMRFEAVAVLPAKGKGGVDVSEAERALEGKGPGKTDAASMKGELVPLPRGAAPSSIRSPPPTPFRPGGSLRTPSHRTPKTPGTVGRSGSVARASPSSIPMSNEAEMDVVVVGAGFALSEVDRRQPKRMARVRDRGPSAERICLFALVCDGEVTKVATGGRASDPSAAHLGGARSIRVTSLAYRGDTPALLCGTEDGTIRSLAWPLATKLTRGWVPAEDEGGRGRGSVSGLDEAGLPMASPIPSSASTGPFSPTPPASSLAAPVTPGSPALSATGVRPPNASGQRLRSVGSILRSGDAAVGSLNAVRLGSLNAPTPEDVYLHGGSVTSIAPVCRSTGVVSGGLDGSIFISALRVADPTSIVFDTGGATPITLQAAPTTRRRTSSGESKDAEDEGDGGGAKKKGKRVRLESGSSSGGVSGSGGSDEDEEDLHDWDDVEGKERREEERRRRGRKEIRWLWMGLSKDGFLTGVTLTESLALLESRRHVRHLTEELSEARADSVKQQRLLERQAKEEARKAEEAAASRLQAAEARAEELARRGDRLAREAAATQRALESAHDRKIRESEAEYERMLGREQRRFLALDEELERLRQEHDQAQSRFEETLRLELDEAERRAKLQSARLEHEVKSLRAALERERKSAELALRDTEAEYEEELSQLKVDGQLQVSAEKKVSTERGRREKALRKRLGSYKRQAETSEARARALYEETEALKEQVAQRDEMLSSQARKQTESMRQLERWRSVVSELRSDLNTLRNHRFVLEHKVGEMAKDRAPLAEHASRLEKKVHDMYHELLQQVDEAKVSSRDRENLKMVRGALAAEAEKLRHQLHVQEQKHAALLRDIELLGSTDDAHMVEAVRGVYKRHIRGEGQRRSTGGARGAAVLAAAQKELSRAFDVPVVEESKAASFPSGEELLRSGMEKEKAAAADRLQRSRRRGKVDLGGTGTAVTSSSSSSSSPPASEAGGKTDIAGKAMGHRVAGDGLVPAALMAESLGELQRQRDFVLRGAVSRDRSLRVRGKEHRRRQLRALAENGELVAEANRLRQELAIKESQLRRAEEELARMKTARRAAAIASGTPSSTRGSSRAGVARTHGADSTMGSGVGGSTDGAAGMTSMLEEMGSGGDGFLTTSSSSKHPSSSSTSRRSLAPMGGSMSMVDESQLVEPAGKPKRRGAGVVSSGTLAAPSFAVSAHSIPVAAPTSESAFSLSESVSAPRLVPLHRGRRVDALGSRVAGSVMPRPALQSAAAADTKGVVVAPGSPDQSMDAFPGPHPSLEDAPSPLRPLSRPSRGGDSPRSPSPPLGWVSEEPKKSRAKKKKSASTSALPPSLRAAERQLSAVGQVVAQNEVDVSTRLSTKAPGSP